MYLQATTALLRPHFLNLKTTFRDNDSAFSLQTYISPGILHLFPPPLTGSLSRRLFRKSLTEGTLNFHTGPQPYITIGIVTPEPFDFTAGPYAPPDESATHSPSRPGSLYGFGMGARYWTYSVTLAGLGSSLRGEWGVTFAELALQVKLGLELGIAGLAWLLTGTWGNETSEVAASVGLSHAGVIMRLEFVRFAVLFCRTRLTASSP